MTVKMVRRSQSCEDVGKHISDKGDSLKVGNSFEVGNRLAYLRTRKMTGVSGA